MKTTNKIIQLLKTEGPCTAKYLADELSLTTMGIRQHMLALEASGDVEFEDRKAARGRPTRFWRLTEKANRYFDDRHEELTLQMIESVRNVFGDDGLEQLIQHREQESMKLYQSVLSDCKSLKSKLDALARLRSEEGYMAKVMEDESGLWLIEDHCPICAAATQCQNFCRSELSMFRSLLADVASVKREEHIVKGARRCAYRIKPK